MIEGMLNTRGSHLFFQKFINFLIRKAKLTKDPNNVRWRQFTCTHIDGDCSFPAVNDTQVYVMIALPMPEKRTPITRQYAQQFPGLEEDGTFLGMNRPEFVCF